MDVGLMNKEDLNTLGLGANPQYIRTEVIEDEKEKKGFIAGLGVVGSNKWSMWS
jgi:hypothetical protein